MCLCDSYRAFSGISSYWCSGRIMTESVYIYSPKVAGCYCTNTYFVSSQLPAGVSVSGSMECGYSERYGHMHD